MTKNLLYTVFALFLTGLSAKAQCPVANAGADRTICQGDTIQLNGNITSGAPQWSTPPPAPITLPFPGLPPINLPSPAKFIPIGTNDTTKSDSVKVTIGMAIPTNITGLTGGGLPPPTVATYTFHYTLTQTGCPTSTDSMTVLVNPLPTALIVPTGNANQSTCTGATTFTVTARKPASGSTGTWLIESPAVGTVTPRTTNDTVAFVSGLAIGATVLKWTVNNGSCEASRTLTITVGSLPTKAVAGSALSGCVGDTLSLIGSKAVSGSPVWSNAKPPARVGFTLPPSIHFTPNGNNDTSKVVLDTAGSFKLYYTISVGTANVNSVCTSRDSLQITATKCGTGIIEYTASDLIVSIQPNPATGSFNLTLKDSKISYAELSVLTLDGRAVITEQLGAVKDVQRAVNISNLSNGIYFVRVKKGDDIYTNKLVVQ